MARVRTHSGKPGKYWNLIITISGREYAGIPSKVLPADNAPSVERQLYTYKKKTKKY